MRRTVARTIAGLLAVFARAACTHHATVSPAPVLPPTEENKAITQPTAEQRALGIYQNFSDADIEFMPGMIPHHAQAVIMAGWAPSHGARSDVAILCERIVVGQTDEIRSIQTRLGDPTTPGPHRTSP